MNHPYRHPRGPVSYCRWSSDDWQCDVYVYESARGYEIHVAANRLVPAAPFPPPNVYDSPDADAAVDAIVDRMMEVSRIAGISVHAPIGGPLDGESYTEPTPGDAADRLEAIRAAGYNVPQYAIDELREEAADTREDP